MEARIKSRIAKAFKNLELGDGNDLIFCFLMEDHLKKRLIRNSIELEYFLKKIGYIYYQKVVDVDADEKIELKLDQLYWPQFLLIKRKCIAETIADTFDILVKHPDVKRILKFTDRKDEENSIRKFLQQFNDNMVEFLNNLLVLQFKIMRKIALDTSYKRKANRSFFQCQGCGEMCSENRPPRLMNFVDNDAINMILGRLVHPSCDFSSDDSEDENEEPEDSSDSDVEDEVQEDLPDSDEIEMKTKSKKKTYRKKVLHFSHGKY